MERRARRELSRLHPFRLAAAAAVLVFTPLAAGAQNGPLPTAAPDPPGLSPPVVASAPSGVYVARATLALAQQVFDLVGAPALRAQTRSLTAGLSVQLAAAMSARDPAHARAMVGAVGDGLASLTPQLQAEAVSHMIHDFTAGELKEMLAFYSSPTGRLAARRMPLILQQSVGSVLTYLPQMMSGVEDSYCKQVTCTRVERHAFDAVAAKMVETRLVAK